jgi:hypothetical protein
MRGMLFVAAFWAIGVGWAAGCLEPGPQAEAKAGAAVQQAEASAEADPALPSEAGAGGPRCLHAH